MSKHQKAVIGLIFVMLVWGSSFPITKMTVGKLPPVYFAFLRFSVASLILLPVLFLRKKKSVAASRPSLKILFPMALTGITFYYVFFNLSLKYTTASAGALLQGFIPVIIAVLATIFLKEKLNFKQVGGILLSVTGVVAVGFITSSNEQASDPLKGNLLMMLCILSWAVYTILSKKLATADSVVVTTYTTVMGTILLIPAVLFEANGQPLPAISTGSWFAVIYLGAMASACCYFLYNIALEHLSAAQVGNFLNIDPVAGSLMAVIILHEKISVLQIFGCILIMAGVWLSTRKAG